MNEEKYIALMNCFNIRLLGLILFNLDGRKLERLLRLRNGLRQGSTLLIILSETVSPISSNLNTNKQGTGETGTVIKLTSHIIQARIFHSVTDRPTKHYTKAGYVETRRVA